MGVTYFAVFVATVLAGILIFLLKNFSDSILLGGKDDAVELTKLHELSIRNEAERRKAEAYIHKHMLSLEQARCQKERRKKREEHS
jgi:hypothetical protein